MLNTIFMAGFLIFAASSAYFYFANRDREGLNTAFLVSFVTLISYAIMWQGKLTVASASGQPIYWTRWLFYGVSCALLMVEIASLRKARTSKMIELIYLTVIVMFTGFLAARDVSVFRWVYFAISSVAYIFLLAGITPRSEGSKWINPYLIFGWTVFPVVFLIAPTGLGLIGSALANLLYLALDLFTKIIFNFQLAAKAKE